MYSVKVTVKQQKRFKKPKNKLKKDKVPIYQTELWFDIS
jgi:hypothetical protein